MWSDFESEVVEGRYPLGRLVRSEGRCGWFETKFDEKTAIISLIESLNDESMLLDRLHAAEKVSDKNVAAILAVGKAAVQETPLVYAVMEYTEENLEDVLRTRALSAEETKQVAESLVQALQAIHKERLVCGRLEAASVLAAGDLIKLRSDYLQLIPPNAAFEPNAAKDVRDLGSLLYQCLTQKPVKSADANDPALQLLPPPFVQILRRTLSGNATLAEIAALLHPPAAIPTVAPVSAQAGPTVRAPVAKPPSVVEHVDHEEAEKPIMRNAVSRVTPRNAWIIGGFLILLLIVGFVVHGMLQPAKHAASERTEQAPPVASAPAATVPKKTITPPMTKANPAPVIMPTASPATGAWRVVAFTYNRQDQAAHKAQTINEKHPDLQASVFSPKGTGAPYLVTIGAATDRTSAFRLREKAIHEGLPRDTYAQNYSQ